MALNSRVLRIERKVLPGSPFEEFTDEGLEAAIVSVKASIEAGTGMPEPDLADRFEKDLANGENTYGLDEHLMRRFIDQVKREHHANG